MGLACGGAEECGGFFTRVTVFVEILCTRVRDFMVHFFVHACVTRVTKNVHARAQCLARRVFDLGGVCVWMGRGVWLILCTRVTVFVEICARACKLAEISNFR